MSAGLSHFGGAREFSDNLRPTTSEKVGFRQRFVQKNFHWRIASENRRNRLRILRHSACHFPALRFLFFLFGLFMEIDDDKFSLGSCNRGVAPIFRCERVFVSHSGQCLTLHDAGNRRQYLSTFSCVKIHRQSLTHSFFAFNIPLARQLLSVLIFSLRCLFVAVFARSSSVPWTLKCFIQPQRLNVWFIHHP